MIVEKLRSDELEWPNKQIRNDSIFLYSSKKWILPTGVRETVVIKHTSDWIVFIVESWRDLLSQKTMNKKSSS